MSGAKAISEGMKINKTVLTLDLQWCGFRDDGSSFLAQMLTENTTLQHLDLSGNNVSLQTCSLLIMTLQDNTTIQVWSRKSSSLLKNLNQELGLRDSPLGTYGARKLLKIVTSGIVRNHPN